MAIADNKVVVEELAKIDDLAKTQEGWNSPAMKDACKRAWEHMAGNVKEVFLQCLFARRPVWTGDLTSKTGRDVLITWGLVVHVCCGGNTGYYCAVERAQVVFEHSGAKRPAYA